MKTQIAVLFALIYLLTLQPAAADIRSDKSDSQSFASLTLSNGMPNEPSGRNPLENAYVAILRESFVSVLIKSRLFEGQPLPLKAWNDACIKKAPVCRQALGRVQEAVVSQGQMPAAGGKMTLPGVPPGNYYVFAYAYSAQMLQAVVWDLSVSLKPGPHGITLDQRNITPLDIRPGQLAQKPNVQPPGTAATPIDAPAATVRPAGPKNSVLNLQALTAKREPVGRTTFYLLDDDFENILKRAGFKRQMLLGEELPLLNSFELLWRWKTMKEGFSFLEALMGQSVFPEEVEQQYAIGVKALTDHTVATIKTNIYGRATFPAVPAGTYFVYGTGNEFVKTGSQGTISGNTVTLQDTGYAQATIWNLKVPVKAGQNSVTLTPDNASFSAN